MDHHLDGRIVRGLRRKGVDVLTAEEDGYERHSDALLLERSTALNRVLVSQDEDFYAETSRCWATDEEFAGVMMIPSGTLTIGQAISTLYFWAATHDQAEFLNRREVINEPFE
ncbi:MAG: DUF5615 family PIN-like protein [Phycisphaeraceae bacterium]